MTEEIGDDRTNTASPRSTRSASQTQYFVRKLESIYEQYAPERIPSAKKVITTIQPGKEEKFIERIRWKYEDPQYRASPQRQLSQVFSQHEPQKLSQVKPLLSQIPDEMHQDFVSSVRATYKEDGPMPEQAAKPSNQLAKQRTVEQFLKQQQLEQAQKQHKADQALKQRKAEQALRQHRGEDTLQQAWLAGTKSGQFARDQVPRSEQSQQSPRASAHSDWITHGPSAGELPLHKQKYAAQLQNIYRQYAPHKLASANSIIMSVPVGQEQVFIERTREQYQPPDGVDGLSLKELGIDGSSSYEGYHQGATLDTEPIFSYMMSSNPTGESSAFIGSESSQYFNSSTRSGRAFSPERNVSLGSSRRMAQQQQASIAVPSPLMHIGQKTNSNSDSYNQLLLPSSVNSAVSSVRRHQFNEFPNVPNGNIVISDLSPAASSPLHNSSPNTNTNTNNNNNNNINTNPFNMNRHASVHSQWPTPPQQSPVTASSPMRKSGDGDGNDLLAFSGGSSMQSKKLSSVTRGQLTAPLINDLQSVKSESTSAGAASPVGSASLFLF